MPIIPNSQRTREELREMGRKGGIASGKARRRRKLIRDCAKDVSQVYFIDLYDLSRIMGIRNPAALEWLLVEMVGGLGKEHKDNLITLDSLLTMGFSPERAQNILNEYQKQDKARADQREEAVEKRSRSCAGAIFTKPRIAERN